MVRGGHRKGAGRRSTWASGCSFENTKLIRVPAAIADQVLELAHRLDADGVESVQADLETKSKTSFGQQLEILIQPIKISINQKQLAVRLNIKPHQISESKRITSGEKSLKQLSAIKDPDGISWKYDSKSKGYTPAVGLTPYQSSRLNEWVAKEIQAI